MSKWSYKGTIILPENFDVRPLEQLVKNVGDSAYQQGRQDVINEIEKHRFGRRGGLVHWKDIEQMKEDENE